LYTYWYLGVHAVVSDKKVEVRVDEELVEYLCRLGRIKLTQDEKKRLKKEIKILLNYINDILAIEGVEEAEELLYPGGYTHLREDKPVVGDGRRHLEGAIIEDGFVKAPRVVEE